MNIVSLFKFKFIKPFLNVLLQYIVPIIALFHGRVIDKPEQAMTETIYSTGGEVEHEVCP